MSNTETVWSNYSYIGDYSSYHKSFQKCRARKCPVSNDAHKNQNHPDKRVENLEILTILCFVTEHHAKPF